MEVSPPTDQLLDAARAAGIGFWQWDRATGITTWDPTLARLFGFEPGTFDGTFEAWLAALHPDDRQAVVGTVEEAVALKRPHIVEHRVVWPDGSVHWIEGRGDVTLDAAGEATGTIGCAWDVTEQVAIARERSEAIAELERAAARDRISRERLEFLTVLNDALACADDPDDVVRRAASAAVPRLGDWCSIARVSDDDPDAVEFEVAHTDPEMVAYARELLERFPYDPSATNGVAAVIRTGRSELIEEIDEEVLASLDTTEERREIARQLALRSSLIVPIRHAGRTLGAMQFVNSSRSRAFTADDVTLANAVADRIASTLENRMLAEELRRDEFRAALDALLDNVTIARAVRDAGGRIVDFTIEYMNASSRDGAGRGPADLVGASVLATYPNLVNSGLFAEYVRVTEERLPHIADRVRYEDTTPDGRSIHGWWSLRVVPFRDGYLASSRDETSAVLAEQELRAARESELRSRDAMRVLQSAALPHELPKHPDIRFGVRYEPANADLPVGGDWYDVFSVPRRDGVGIVIADVAGHGMEAAGVMLRVRNALRAYAVEGDDPGHVLERANSLLCSDGGGSPFVTCSYALIDVSHRTLSWACAGHFPPMRLRSGTAASLECALGTPLGVDPSCDYATATDVARPGDLLVWFTDGLIERRTESIDVGLERLRALIATLEPEPQALVDRIVADLAEDCSRGDDLAVVAVRVG